MENNLIPESLFSSKITIIEKRNFDNTSIAKSSNSYEEIHPINKFVISDNGSILDVNSKVIKTNHKNSNLLMENEKIFDLKKDLK